MKKLLLLPLLVIFLCNPLDSYAQYNNSSNTVLDNGFGIGPRLGYYKANDAEDGNFYGGLQLRGRLSQYFGLEASVEYRAKQKYNATGGEFKTSMVPVTASALLFLPVSQHFSPYGIAGLGAYYTFYDSGGIINGTNHEFNLGYHLGFGVQFPLGESVSLNADYRYLFLNSDTNDENFNGDYSGNEVTVSLMFYL